MDKLTEAVKVLRETPPEDLANAKDIEKLFSLLKRVCKSSTTVTIATKRLQELRDFCDTNEPDAVVGKLPDYDYRIIDVRLVDGKSRSDDLRRIIRRAMGERSLAEDYLCVYPGRLDDACESGRMRGKKRNSDSIMTYATTNFPQEETAIVVTAIRNGLKALALEEIDIQPENEEMDMLPAEKRAGFMGLVAISHRSFCRMTLEKLAEDIGSLPEVLKLVFDISPLMLAAYKVYKRQAPDHQASKRQRLCGVGDSYSSSDPASVASPSRREQFANQAGVISHANAVYPTTSDCNEHHTDVFMPQGQYQSGSTVADSAVVHLLSGNDVTRRPPRSPSTVNQQAVLQSSYTPYIHDPSPMDPWLAADFSHFGEAPTSLFQVANFSQFGGTYTEVAQPADFSDFGNTSTVMPPTSVWPVNEHNIHFLHGEH